MRLGLRAELLVTFALVTLFAIALNAVVVWRVNTLVLRRERLEQALTTARTAGALAAGDPQAAADRISKVEGVEGVECFDAIGKELCRAGTIEGPFDEHTAKAARVGDASAHVFPVPTGTLLRVIAPIGDPDHPEGALVVWMKSRGSREPSRGLVLWYLAFNAFLVGAFGWWLLSRSVVRPVRRLVEATRRVTEGDLGVRVPVGKTDELGILARDFNRMLDTLRENESAIERHVRELEAANESLRMAREEVIQSEKLASVGRLAAGVAHELGNPVGAVTGYVSALRHHPSDDRKQDEEVLARIEREMKRIDRIIRDLLDYARPRAETHVALAPKDVVEGAIAIVSMQRGFQNTTLERKLADVPEVRGDAHRLQQVLVNLLINAADAVETTSAKVVTVETALSEFPAPPESLGRRREDASRPSGPAVAIRVRDTGIGIPPGNLPLVFDPFFTTKEPGRGTGLGLAIARPIVESFGGRLLVESEVGKGTTFTVLLPPIAK